MEVFHLVNSTGHLGGNFPSTKMLDVKGEIVEFIPVNASIHYKCALDVYCSDNDGLTSIRRVIRSWCLSKT